MRNAAVHRGVADGQTGAADASRRDDAPETSSIRTAAVVAVAVALAAALLDALQWAQGGVVSPYDSGVYFVASVHLVHGEMPYRSYLFLQPPGILVLLAPLAELTRFLSPTTAFSVARGCTLAISAANAGLTAWIVRRRGVLPMVVAGGVVAVSAANVVVATGVKVDPVFLFFTLLAVGLTFSSEPLIPGSRRARVAAMAWGVAAAIKLWAILPLAILVVVLAPRHREYVRRLLTVAAITWSCVCAPFAAADPAGFVRDVVWLQLTRTGSRSVSTTTRLIDLSVVHAGSAVGDRVVAAVIGALALASVVWVVRRGRRRPLDLFVVGTAFFTTTAVLVTPQYFDYYAYVSTPFVALLLAIALSHLIDGAPRPVGPFVRRSSTAVVAAALLAGALFSLGTYRAASFAVSPRDVATARREIPVGSCVTFDNPVLAVLLDRVDVSRRCAASTLVDPSGVWIAVHADQGTASAAVAATWLHVLSTSQFVVLVSPYDAIVPWYAPSAHPLIGWFQSHFRLESSAPNCDVYERIT